MTLAEQADALMKGITPLSSSANRRQAQVKRRNQTGRNRENVQQARAVDTTGYRAVNGLSPAHERRGSRLTGAATGSAEK
jgi:hypothetical protein